MNISKIVASWGGIGFIKGGGTVAAVVTCVIIYFLNQHALLTNPWILPIAAVVITLIGIYTGDVVEPDWGKDSSRVVIDEVAGQMISLLFIPLTNTNIVIGLILFRFFDILKPLGVRNMEKFKGGTGVMMDDVLAGVYANIVLQTVIWVVSTYWGNLSLDLRFH